MSKSKEEVVSSEEHRLTAADGEQTSADKLPYPRGIPFIIVSKFLERLSFLGVQAILVIYLTTELNFTSDQATVIFHASVTLVFSSAIFGAVLSDNYLGKFRTVLFMGGVFVSGSFILAASAVPLAISARYPTLLALFLLSLGSGCLKPCLLAFGGDQFQFPAQANQAASFFSLFYMTLKAPALICVLLMPILRSDYGCFGRDTCFLLPFGVCAVSATLATSVFLSGKRTYVMKPSSKNVLVRIVKCVYYALTHRSEQPASQTGLTSVTPHWLDVAGKEFDAKIVQDSKILLNILLLYVPIPLYWALEEQIGSRFTIQATGMDGSLGFYTIKPDQMQVVHPILVLIFISLNDAYLNKCWTRMGVGRPLPKMCVGGFLVAISFLLTGTVETYLQPTYAVLPKASEYQLRIFNSMPCDYVIRSHIFAEEHRSLKSMDMLDALVEIPATESRSPLYLLQSLEPLRCSNFSGNFHLSGGRTASYHIGRNGIDEFEGSAAKSIIGRVYLTVMRSDNRTLQIVNARSDSISYTTNSLRPSQISLLAGDYGIYLGDTWMANKTLASGAVQSLLIAADMADESGPESRWFQISEPNSMHMLWMLPQYICLAMGDAMFSVTGLAFTYSEAPVHMKTVMQAFWLLMLSFGNVIDIIVVGAKLFESQAHEFFAFSALMFADMGLFMWLARRYKRCKYI